MTLGDARIVQQWYVRCFAALCHENSHNINMFGVDVHLLFLTLRGGRFVSGIWGWELSVRKSWTPVWKCFQQDRDSISVSLKHSLANKIALCFVFVNDLLSIDACAGEKDGEVVASAIRIPWGSGIYFGSYYYVDERHRGKGYGTRLRDEVDVG